MTLSHIYTTFQSFETVQEKLDYLLELERLNLPYDINYEYLRKCWENVENQAVSEE